MKTVRIIDWHIQLIIAVISLVLFWTYYVLLIGELVLVVWQVISALANTIPMLRSPFRKKIRIYWALVVIALILVILPSDLLQGISLVGSWGIAAYYWWTYKCFMDHLEHRKELGTLLRH